MRKLSKKISMLMVLAMLVGLFSGVVSASAASAWSFKSKNYNVAVGETIVMGNKEYADFDLLKDGKAPTGYTVTWASSDENVVWVNAKTGQLRANKLGMANEGDKAVISATFTNNATKKSATRSFVIAYGEQKYELVTKIGDVVLGEETLTVGESYKLATTVLDGAGNSVDFKTCKLYRNYFIDGKAIENPFVPDKAGEIKITVAAFAKKADMDDFEKRVETAEAVEYTVEATTGEFSAEADSIYTFKVTGKFAKDADFTVVKNGTQKVAVKSKAVAEDGASAVITLTNKLTKGIYTITCDEQKAEVDVDDERADKIVIKEADDVVYTGRSGVSGSAVTDLVYVHYDVYNQYGDSIRKSTTIEWSYNADSHEDDKNLGILTLKETSGFRFGDLVVLNGVALNNGQKPINVSASMKVNLEQAASKIEIIGVVKNNSNVLLQEVPANFVGGEYSLVFKMFDRKDYPMHYDADMAKDDFSFVSMDPLLIADIVDGTVGDFGTVYIDGTAYGKLAIAPGIQSKFGGYAEIKAISNKTGIESPKEIRVVSDQIVQSFEIQTPDNIVARNAADSSATNIKLDYIALDEEGDKITDFRALYKAISFSSRDFVMKENNDGIAELWYTVDVSTIKPEKSYDAAAIVTTILYTGSGNAATKQLNIKLDRIASETGDYKGDADVLEGGNIQVKIADNLKFLDQYGDELKSTNLFRSTKDTLDNRTIDYAGGTPFEKRLVAVRVKKAAANAFNATNFTITGGSPTALGYSGTDYMFFDPMSGQATITLTAGKNFTEGVEEFPVEFVLYDAIKKEFVGGSSKVVTFKVHDLSQVVEFSVDVSDKYSKDANDDAVVAKDLKGTLRNGKKVSVPVGLATSGTAVAVVKYVLRDYDFKLEASTVTGGPVLEPSSTLTYGVVSGSYSTTVQKLPEKNSILGDANVDNWLLYKDQSQHTVDGWFKDRNLVYDITVDVYKDDANSDGSDQFRGTAKATTDFGNVERKYVSFDYVDDYKINGKNLWIKKGTEAYVHATEGNISSELLRKYITGVKDNYGDAKGTYMTADDTVTMTITKAVEGGKGLVEDGKYTKPEHLTHMLTVKLAETTISDANLYMITGAEIGDTFYVTYTVKGHPVTTTVKFTVGSDIKAEFSDYNDKCDYR